MRAEHRALHHNYRNAPALRIEFDLSRNELHLGPLPEVRRLVETGAGTLNRYPPDHGVAQLAEQIGAVHAVARTQVVVGAGSAGVLDALLHAHPQAGASTVYGTPTFDEYTALVSRAGGIHVQVPSDPPGAQTLEAILSRVDVSTRQVVIATPHNPTGAAVGIDELIELRNALPASVLLVVDQAYAEFDRTLPPDALRRIVSELDQVVVLRSFSKAHGLAGLRIGYGVFSCATLAAQVRSAVPTYSVNSLAVAAAAESLRHPRQLQERVSRVVADRERLEDFLARQGLSSGVASQGNFVWLPTPDSAALARHALSRGIFVREYAGVGVRITVQSADSVDAVVNCLATFSASVDA